MRNFPSCVTPEGHFHYGIHKPAYTAANLRLEEKIQCLGTLPDQALVDNRKNFPENDVSVEAADWIFEIPNPFPFRGVTFIDKEWADASARDDSRISLPSRPEVSLSTLLTQTKTDPDLLEKLPAPMLLALATCSTDPDDLKRLAKLSCAINFANGDKPISLQYTKDNRGRIRSIIHDHALFEAVANNPFLPDAYKIVMVLRPGAQGGSEIVGEWPKSKDSHIFEYLRQNSYIPGGHYAANMADDAIRYSIESLTPDDMKGLRHLYYQRIYVSLASRLGITPLPERRPLSPEELEGLRLTINKEIAQKNQLRLATLWGWNFGFDYAPSNYRLHASHQQIHQQYAMIPEQVAKFSGNPDNPTGFMPAYCCGDMIAGVVEQYHGFYKRDFFDDYLRAIADNQRMDGRSDRESALIVWQDEKVMLFVPKAQTSQWELQLMTKKNADGMFPGNILETNEQVRNSLDIGILQAQKALAALGARMVTTIEYSKRLGPGGARQPLLYALLPRLPESPGAFSEAQLRFINGHYPEDFAAVCRRHLR
jgi:hypothetical protein